MNLHLIADSIREVELRISQEYSKQEMKTPIHLCLGQEAIPVAVCSLLKPTDTLFAYYRSHGWYLAKGGNLNRMIAELYGKQSGCSGGTGGSMHLIDLSVNFQGTTAIVGGHIPHAVGFARANQMQGKDDLVVCAFGDGATEQGVFTESLMVAAKDKLKVLFICVNDGMAVEIPIKQRQRMSRVVQRASALGLVSYMVDGRHNNPENLQVAIQSIIAEYQYPIFIEILAKRDCDHVGPRHTATHAKMNLVIEQAVTQAFQFAKETHVAG